MSGNIEVKQSWREIKEVTRTEESRDGGTSPTKETGGSNEDDVEVWGVISEGGTSEGTVDDCWKVSPDSVSTEGTTRASWDKNKDSIVDSVAHRY